ncbi:MAG: hypothetical protein QOD36_2303 [Mycobacterium sp.]|nr:hypothetical protein [Mycobacterium sp.]
MLAWPNSSAYETATTPHNSTVAQRPAVVGRPQRAEDVAEAVRWAAERNLVVTVQASGHGAGALVGPDYLLVDTSGLDDVTIDVDGRIARVGSGATWAAVNAKAERHGLLGLAGSSPTVAVAGYTFGGGVGWLTRPYGMASAALLAVDYIDGNGQMRRASEDATDPVDRAALWAFRGGGGVGIATTLTVEVVAPPAMWAGYQLWDIVSLEPVTAAWVNAIDELGDALSTSISVLHTPPGSPFPAALRGVPIVHVAFASAAGADAAHPLLRALRHAPRPTVDSSWAAADSARLAQIHLDPPAAVPALGMGRWLGPATSRLASDVLGAAAAPDSALTMVELRNVDNTAPVREGAQTAVPGPFLLHGVGLAVDPRTHAATEHGLTEVRDLTRSADVGLAAASFEEGQAEVVDGLSADALRELSCVRQLVDPDRRLAPSRLRASPSGV